MKNILIFCGQHGFLSDEESRFSDDGQVIVCTKLGMCGAECFVKSADYLILRTENNELKFNNERLEGDLQAAIGEADELSDIIFNLESDISGERW